MMEEVARNKEMAVDSGDTAWMLTSCVIVLGMTMPGLALYYSGMVRELNVLSTLMQTVTITCLITVEWLLVGYSLAFAPVNALGDHGVIGDASRFWLQGLHFDTFHTLAPTIPEAVYCLFQLTFAIITAALICGSFAERMKYKSMIAFMFLWHIIVYCPVAYSNWHPGGFLFRAGVLDFAGGNVVHINSGMAGLMVALVLGPREGFHAGDKKIHAQNIQITFLGAAMLWIGWFGFNAGSSGAARERAGMAILSTHIAASTAGLSWMLAEAAVRGRPSVLGMVSGVVAGLVCVTPASGYVNPTGAFFIGLFGGPLCYHGAQLKHRLGFDDTLDAFGIHAIGGIVGGLMTGLFADVDSAGVFYAGSGTAGWKQLGIQIYGIVMTLLWSSLASFAIAKVLDRVMGLRISKKAEFIGQDAAELGEVMTARHMKSDMIDGIIANEVNKTHHHRHGSKGGNSGTNSGTATPPGRVSGLTKSMSMSESNDPIVMSRTILASPGQIKMEVPMHDLTGSGSGVGSPSNNNSIGTADSSIRSVLPASNRDDVKMTDLPSTDRSE